MAKTKAGGSSRNGRDSIGRRLGQKLADGSLANPGSIIYRQRGTRIYPGKNVGIGRDFTLYSKIEGLVRFSKQREKKVVSVIPLNQ